MDDNNLANFLFETGSLRKIIRAHQQEFFTSDPTDNISSHSYRTAIIGLFLALEEAVDLQKVLIMTLLHDIAETRSNDQNWVHKKYIKVYEDEIIEDQLKTIPHSNYISTIISEYRERETKEAIVAKDADIIDQILLLKEYEMQGNKEASRWLQGKEQEKRLQTESAKALAKKIKTTGPNDWTRQSWTSERR